MSQLSLLDQEPPESDNPTTDSLDRYQAQTEENLPFFLSGLNPDQKLAVEQPAHQAVRVLAGAGTGKTELIARRYVKLVKELQNRSISNPQQHLLVVTFTNDAAVSMRQKIAEHLLKNDEDDLSSDAWLGTFHQFCHRLLRKHGLRVGLSPQFGILDSLSQKLLFQRLIDSILAGEYESPARQGPLQGIFQRSALSHLPVELFTLSHFESIGFRQLTDILETDRLFRFIQQAKATGLNPAEFNRLAKQQTDAFTQTLITLPTHALEGSQKISGADVLAGYFSDWQRHLSLWKDARWNPLAQAEALNSTPGASEYKKTVEKILPFYCSYDRSKRAWLPVDRQAGLISDLAELTRLEHQLIDVLSGVYALYQHQLLTSQVCDFDDLINHCIHLLETDDNLRKQYQQQFEAIIVDEFQDSNTSQLRLLKLLCRNIQKQNPSIEGMPGNLTIVGDQKQSIYRFRFAQPENVHLVFYTHTSNTKDNLANANQPIDVTLKTNYRSYPPVLSAANLTSRMLIGDDSQQLQPRTDYSCFEEPLVRLITLGISEEILTEKGERKTVKEPLADQKDREALWIATEIEHLLKEKKHTYRDMAILVRSHGKADLIQRALTARQIPSIRRKNLGFFEEPVIKDAMALLQLMLDVRDELALTRILQNKLNHRQLRLLALCRDTLNESFNKENKDSHKRHMGLFDVLLQLNDPATCPEITHPLRGALMDLAEGLRDLKQRSHNLNSALLLTELARRIGLIQKDSPEYLKKQQRIHLKTLEKLLTVLTVQSRIQPTLQEILATLNRYRNDPHLELPVTETVDDEDAVSIMTVHGAKGLEFPVVFAAYCEREDKSPSLSDECLIFDPQFEGKAGFGLILGQDLRRQGNSYKAATLKKEVYKTIWHVPQCLAEAQRLFYVALTRAQQRLYVIRSDQSPTWSELVHPHIDHWIESEHLS